MKKVLSFLFVCSIIGMIASSEKPAKADVVVGCCDIYGNVMCKFWVPYPPAPGAVCHCGVYLGGACY